MLRQGLCVVLLAIVLPANTGVCSETAFENLTNDVGRGYGNTWNRYAWSMGELNGQTFVGTWSTQFDYVQLVSSLGDGFLIQLLLDMLTGGNPLESIGFLASDGAEIWRHDGGQAWTQVYKATPDTSGFRKAVTHNGTLYMGALNDSEGTRIIYSDDGETWTILTGGPMDNADNISIRTMLSHDGKLYAGTENNATGGELWAYDDGAKSWSLITAFPEDSSVAELAVWDDRITVGTWDFTDSYNFYIQDPGGQWQLATPVFPGSDELSNVGVMKLITFQGQLYLGTVNYSDGFTLLRSAEPQNPHSWEVISTNGFGNSGNAYTWAMVEWNGKLMLGTFNSDLKAAGELYSSSDGMIWDFVPGDYANTFNYGIRNMLVTSDGDLLLGMASNFFIADLGSSLYTPMFIRMLGNAWLAQAMQSALTVLKCIRLGEDPRKPWIGCEIYRAVELPAAQSPRTSRGLFER